MLPGLKVFGSTGRCIAVSDSRKIAPISRTIVSRWCVDVLCAGCTGFSCLLHLALGMKLQFALEHSIKGNLNVYKLLTCENEDPSLPTSDLEGLILLPCACPEAEDQ